MIELSTFLQVRLIKRGCLGKSRRAWHFKFKGTIFGYQIEALGLLIAKMPLVCAILAPGQRGSR